MKKKLLAMLLMLALVIGVTVLGVAAEETTTAEHTAHCECGGNLTGAAQTAHAADCAAVETWTEVNTTNFKNGGIFSKPGNYLNFNESGHYYLTADVATGYVIEIKAGQEITICLNGHQLKSDAGSNSAIRLYGKLTICDCQGGGKVTAKTAKTAGLVNMLTTTSNETIFNLYGGDLTMTDNDHTANAGVVQVANNTNNNVIFNMYGGSISGGVANKGGNILIGSAKGTMNMYGGSVTGGRVQTEETNTTNTDRNRGGNIYVNLGTLNVYGGTISGGVCAAEDKYPALGGDIYQNGGTVNLNTAFGALDYANSGSGYLTLGENFSATNVACKSLAAVPVKVAEGTEAQAKAFTAAVSEYYVAYENGEMTLKMIPVESIDLKYDDRKDLNTLVGAGEGATVTISDQVVTSKAVGTETADANVLVYENGVLYAVGTGTAKLTVDGTSYDVTVSPAPISLFMITGHSIGRGEKGNGAQSVAMEAGQAYSTHRYHTYNNIGSVAIINPDELTDTTGLGYGAANRLTGIDAFAAGQGGTEGEGSALAWQWNQLTGEKVWIINAAVGGSCLNEWIPGAEGHNATYTYHYDTSVAAFKNAQAILDKEIAAGHYTLSHTAIIYHSAANFSYFSDWTQELIEDYYDQMWSGYKTELGVEVMGLVPIWSAAGRNNIWNDKPANFYMAASEQYEDVFMASVITRNWMTASGLSSFPDITYTTQSAAVSKPTSVHHTDQGGTSTNSVFCSTDTTHLSQVTYNAQGIDIANNMYAYFGGDKTASSVELRTSRNGLLGDSLELAVGENTYAVPLVDKVYANNLTISVEGDITVKFPVQIVAEKEGVGTITVSQGDKVLKTLTVTVTAAHNHCVCGGHVEGHACENVTWTPWGDDYDEYYALPTTAGYYYLTKDMTISNEYNIGEDTEIFLCLNGHNITNTKTDKRVYNIYGKLSIADCAAEENWGTISGSRCDETASALAGTFQLRDNREGKTATLNLYGGILTAANPNVLKQAGVVQLGNTGDYGAVVNMYGGKIIGSNATNGGAVYIMKNSVFNLYGGTVSGGTATGRGGNFYIEGENSQLNISGGVVTGGTALNGGNVYMNTGAAVNITGGTVENGLADSTSGYGGNIRVNAGTLTVTGVTLSGGAARYGGSLAVQGTAAITDSTVQTKGGTRGRALYIDKAGVVTVKDSTLSNLSPDAGTAVWILGKLNLQGTVNITKTDTASVKDILLDAQTGGSAVIDISGLTGQDEPYTVRRWEQDENDDDPGLVATGATEESLAMFESGRVGYTLTYADGQIYLANCNIQGMDAEGNVICGYATMDELMAAQAGEETYYLINADLDGGTITRDVIINLSGKHLTNVTVNEGVTVSLIDTANDNYDAAACGSLSGTVNGTITPIFRADATNLGAVKPYVVVFEDGKYSAHRYSVMLSAVSLKPDSDALGYKATFKVDDVLASYVTGYGFNLWLEGCNAQSYAKTDFAAGELTLRLQNILKNNGGELTVNGEAFITFRTITGAEETRKSASYATSMKETLQTVNAAWYNADGGYTYSEEQMAAVKALCDKYAVTQAWELTNIYPVEDTTTETTEPEETVTEA